MPTRSPSHHFLPYVGFIIVALALSWLVHSVPQLREVFRHAPEGLYLVLALLLAVGYGLNSFAPRTQIPSFVWAIFFGIALQPAMRLLTDQLDALRIVVELLAALVLFGGGIEVPFKGFKEQFGPIASVSLIGTLMTALLFALTAERISPWFSASVPAITALVLGSILASTDPTAIIPSLKALHLRRPFLRDIAVSESALNDVAGTIITRFFLVSVLSALSGANVLALFMPFLRQSTANILALQIVWGVVVGVIGAGILKQWYRRGQSADPALLFSIPIFTFAVGSLLGGSGFLAAFVAGLLTENEPYIKPVRHFFATFVDGFIKPIIFILLGALVPFQTLLHTLPLGVVAAFIFMFLIRPFVVYLSLFPWTVGAKPGFTWRDIAFLSFIRETGVIPAVLMLVAISSHVPAANYLFAIGMWVILLTLLIEPPLTPWFANKIGVAIPARTNKKRSRQRSVR